MGMISKFEMQWHKATTHKLGSREQPHSAGSEEHQVTEAAHNLKSQRQILSKG